MKRREIGQAVLREPISQVNDDILSLPTLQHDLGQQVYVWTALAGGWLRDADEVGPEVVVKHRSFVQHLLPRKARIEGPTPFSSLSFVSHIFFLPYFHVK